MVAMFLNSLGVTAEEVTTLVDDIKERISEHEELCDRTRNIHRLLIAHTNGLLIAGGGEHPIDIQEILDEHKIIEDLYS
jgi:hypothetical protein